MKTLERLISGVIFLDHKDQIYRLVPPDLDLRQSAELYCEQLRRSYRFVGAVKEDDLFRSCIRQGIIHKDYKNHLKGQKSKVDDIKIELYNCGPRVEQSKRVKKRLDLTRAAYNKTYAQIQNIYAYSLEGLIESAKHNYLLVHGLYTEQGDPVKDDRLINILIKKINSDTFTEAEIRSYARSERWRSIWRASNLDAFWGTKGMLTDEQSALVHFSEMYDFAGKAENTPDQHIFEDDDLFDGWYLKTVRDLISGKSNDDKYGDAQEVFIVAESEDDARSIYNQNSHESRQIIQDRNKALKGGKTLKYAELPDVKRDLMMQSNNKFNSKMRGS